MSGASCGLDGANELQSCAAASPTKTTSQSTVSMNGIHECGLPLPTIFFSLPQYPLIPRLLTILEIN